MMSDLAPNVRAALADPAFHICMSAAIAQPDLVREFDRLYGANLSGRGTGLDLAIDEATGRTDGDCAAFVTFVHRCVYLPMLQKADEWVAG